MSGYRRFSQAISEGDGISILVAVATADDARVAHEQGAEGIVIAQPVDGLAEATELPVLFRGGSHEAASRAAADAVVLELGHSLEDVLSHARDELGLDCVIAVHDDEQLAAALEHDPEIFLLRGDGEDVEQALEDVLDLLPDVPAGKLAIADVHVTDREQVVALERAGIDAVIVAAGDVRELVGGAPPEV